MIRLTRPKRETGESIVPMINVAFLLLIFFLMVAVIAPPDPLALTLPQADLQETAEVEDEIVLVIGGDGQLLATSGSEPNPDRLGGQHVVLRADAETEAKLIASVLSDLTGFGVAEIRLAVTPE